MSRGERNPFQGIGVLEGRRFVPLFRRALSAVVRLCPPAQPGELLAQHDGGSTETQTSRPLNISGNRNPKNPSVSPASASFPSVSPASVDQPKAWCFQRKRFVNGPEWRIEPKRPKCLSQEDCHLFWLLEGSVLGAAWVRRPFPHIWPAVRFCKHCGLTLRLTVVPGVGEKRIGRCLCLGASRRCCFELTHSRFSTDPSRR